MKQVHLGKFINKKHVNVKSGILRRFSLTFMAIVGAVGLSISPMTNVFAASPFDTSIKPISTLTIASANGSHSQNITTSYMSVMDDACGATTNYSTAYISFLSALSDEDGRWAIVQSSTSSTSNKRIVWIGWSTNPYDAVIFDNFDPDYMVRVDTEAGVQLSINDSGVVTCSGAGIVLGGSSDFYGGLGSVFVSTYPVSYPSGYAGQYIPGGATRDYDQDGLSDYVESAYFPDRNDVFCDTTVNPYVCAYPNPLEKDIYVEVDWMDDGTTEYKPTSTQLSMVESMFDDQDINIHFDTGQYGGGQEIPISLSNSQQEYLLRVPKSGVLDYYDYRDGGNSTATGGSSVSAHFSSDRNSIWRYMISGYKYSSLDDLQQVQTSQSTGWAQVLGVNTFISAGRLKDLEQSVPNVNKSVAGTLAHEIGHMLCLSDSQVFEEQPSSCVYAGIDNNDVNSPYYDLQNYDSVMNYRYQLSHPDVEYSDGTHGSGDHNDWNGVTSGMGLFSSNLTIVSSGASTVITPSTPSSERPVIE